MTKILPGSAFMHDETVLSLLLIRRQISQRSMRAFGVIEAVDIFEDGLVELIIIMAGAAVGFFFLAFYE